MIDTSGWDMIARFVKDKNNRGAYLALRVHYESAAYHDVEKTEVTSLMAKSF